MPTVDNIEAVIPNDETRRSKQNAVAVLEKDPDVFNVDNYPKLVDGVTVDSVEWPNHTSVDLNSLKEHYLEVVCKLEPSATMEELEPLLKENISVLMLSHVDQYDKEVVGQILENNLKVYTSIDELNNQSYK